ncbi:MAG: AraC family transcriptional regulator [Ilumatobacteraceae bacterium]
MTVHLRSRSHDHHELAWLSQGTVAVRIDDHEWTVSATQALWIPAGVEHEVVIGDHTLITPYWFEPASLTVPWTVPTALAVDEEIAARMARITQLWLSHEVDARRATDEMKLVLPLLQQRAPGLALPRSDAARTVAVTLLGDPGDARSLEAWARHVNVSARTLRRAFVAETGLGFVDWRSTARIFASLPMLAGGDQVGAVAHRVGYTSANGYIAAFRKHLGTTPARFCRS